MYVHVILSRMGHRTRLAMERPVLDAETARTVADTMQALATPSRVRILDSLSAGPLSVGELATEIGMEQSAVSHQLRLLRQLRLVVSERSGRNIIYALHDGHVAVLLNEALSHVEHLRLGLSDSASARKLEEATR